MVVVVVVVMMLMVVVVMMLTLEDQPRKNMALNKTYMFMSILTYSTWSPDFIRMTSSCGSPSHLSRFIVAQAYDDLKTDIVSCRRK